MLTLIVITRTPTCFIYRINLRLILIAARTILYHSLPLIPQKNAVIISIPCSAIKQARNRDICMIFYNIALLTTGGQINASICPPAVNLPPQGEPVFPCRISAAWKNRSFTLQARKYELRVAEPFISCRALVPMMTAAYAHRSTPNARSGFFFLCLLHRFSFSNALLRI